MSRQLTLLAGLVAAMLVLGDASATRASLTDDRTFVVTPVWGNAIPSLFTVGSQIWMTDIDMSSDMGTLDLVTSRSHVRSIQLPVQTIGGRLQRPAPVYAAAAATQALPHGIVFSWQTQHPQGTSVPYESGLGVAEASDVRAAVLYAGGRPSDPLYTQGLTDQFRGPLTVADGRVWSMGPSPIFATAHRIWALPYPISLPASYLIAPVTNTALDYEALSTDPHGNLWGTSPLAVVKVSPAGQITQTSNDVVSFAGTVGADGKFWITELADADGVARVDAQGNIERAFLGLPYLNPEYLLAGKRALWGLNTTSDHRYQIVRVGYDGASSTYTSNAVSSGWTTPTAGLETRDTVWFGVAHGATSGTHAALVSFDARRSISVEPFSVLLVQNAQATVKVSETRYAGAFTPLIETSSGPSGPCPLAVSPSSGTTFTIRALGEVPPYCGVTFTDANGFAAALVTVNS